MQVLAEAFVVGKEERFVAAERTSDGGAELIALERRSGTLIEEIGRVESVVAQEFECGSVPLIAPRSSDDYHLTAGALTQFCAVGVALHVKFADCVHAQQHAARATWLHVILRSARVLDPVEQEKILLRTPTRHGEHVADRGIGRTDAAGPL